ncbi:N-acetylmannosamine-6-phosphate 2-epimerase [Caproiciproducens galactitolivorans]|jgi:N-acylglucosamine-6-phosphate 2-epimerase|uniref:Putative N-acetylmannosamine-6-phosphate 2-epimerase n=1 Tax=Caproiciproducens galactitolivorans TaxID=642589 RepID=A0A4Z0Y307_9FIRM|nr:N-acetylmannosamine-6-phosphate 2-epimerase [Caproiciproducens galactitolivorans]NLG93528.1 N-acetylmannosamine-6-phosphate 2-epimerase [Clostridiales bacterium]QEY35535.1 N-acetylmannosamine-6-phosphate 2-epimerase [Caproiciproducens galactitolivorans]TGJ77257.1 putative N-acetylmannosamine-6-phosphate 2-epimerase [Caproiciproducens galactitolivorans]
MLEKVKGKLIVSCQALEDEPLHSSFIMGRMALAAKQGGAAGIRAQSKEDIDEIIKVTGLPVIGIVKRNYKDSEIYITPTRKEVEELLATGSEMIALDATLRDRPNGEKIEDLLKLIHDNGRLAMADCSTYEEVLHAEKLGFDCVSTTLCGYTPYSENLPGPNLELIRKLSSVLHVPLIAEGKINTPQDLKAVFEAGAYSAVVGGAITRPQNITAKFTEVLNR